VTRTPRRRDIGSVITPATLFSSPFATPAAGPPANAASFKFGRAQAPIVKLKILYHFVESFDNNKEIVN
jgi:hypothetical protein